MSKSKRFLFGSEPRTAFADAGLLVLRVFTGLALALAHGLGKVPPSDGFVGMVGKLGFPVSEVFAWGSGFIELGGGLLLAAGLLTRPAAALIAVNMTVAVFLAHAGDPFGGREKALLFGVIALTFAVIGAGRYSIDALLRR